MQAWLQRAIADLAHWPPAWRLIWAATPGYSVLWLGALCVQSLVPLGLIYLTRTVVDSLVAVVAVRDSDHLATLLASLALFAGLLIAQEGMQSASEWIRATVAEQVQDHIKDRIHQKAVALDLAYFESPAFHDQLELARTDSSGRPQAVLESLGSLVQNGITLVGLTVVLIPLSPWLPLLLLLSVLPAVLLVLRYDRRLHAWWLDTMAARRRAQYFDLVLTTPTAAAELRLFDLGTHFRASYQALRSRLRTERLRQLRQQSLARLGARLTMLVIVALVLAWMVWRSLHGLVSLGDVALLYQAFQRGQTLIQGLLGSLSQTYSNTLFLGNLFAFLGLPVRSTEPAQPRPAPRQLTQGIRFTKVTFRYPGSREPVLRDFDLEIPAGKIVAIVGPNGAGKSTLVKLLCRFYDPDEGQITIDGIDIRQYRRADLHRLITMLFQFPVPYHASAHDNIGFGDLVAAQDQAQVELAARLAGAHDLIMSLPQGYATQLGKWFAEGVELSGGEWQRIAMARAFLRRAPVIILDEPTSFLDSWAESDWFARLRALAHGHTSLLITHRFTIARRADLICVLERGQVVEIGTHAELLALGGRYAASWSRQIAQEETADPADVRAAQRGPAHDPALSPPSTSEMRPSQPALPPPAR